MAAFPVFVAVPALADEAVVAVVPAFADAPGLAEAGGIEPGRAPAAARGGVLAPFAPAAGRAAPGVPVAREVAETRTGVVPDGPCCGRPVELATRGPFLRLSM